MLGMGFLELKIGTTKTLVKEEETATASYLGYKQYERPQYYHTKKGNLCSKMKSLKMNLPGMK